MLSQDEVKHIGTLARVGLTNEEVKTFQKDLSTVLDWFDELKEADTSSVTDAATTTGEVNRMADDAKGVDDDGEREAIVKSFPETKDGFNKVKSVF